MSNLHTLGQVQVSGLLWWLNLQHKEISYQPTFKKDQETIWHCTQQHKKKRLGYQAISIRDGKGRKGNWIIVYSSSQFWPPILEALIRVHLADSGLLQPILQPPPDFQEIRNQDPSELSTENFTIGMWSHIHHDNLQS